LDADAMLIGGGIERNDRESAKPRIRRRIRIGAGLLVGKARRDNQRNEDEYSHGGIIGRVSRSAGRAAGK
jgi:hypothetical protein